MSGKTFKMSQAEMAVLLAEEISEWTEEEIGYLDVLDWLASSGLSLRRDKEARAEYRKELWGV